MIAHRLQTIKTAQNLLFIESKQNALAAHKGTPEYDELIERLEKLNEDANKPDESPEKKKETKDLKADEMIKDPTQIYLEEKDAQTKDQ